MTPVAHLRPRRQRLCHLLQRHLLRNQLAQHRLLPLLRRHLPREHLGRQPGLQIRLHLLRLPAHRRQLDPLRRLFQVVRWHLRLCHGRRDLDWLCPAFCACYACQVLRSLVHSPRACGCHCSGHFGESSGRGFGAVDQPPVGKLA